MGVDSSAELHSAANSYSDGDVDSRKDGDAIKEPLSAEDERIEGLLRKRILTMLLDERGKHVDDGQSK